MGKTMNPQRGAWPFMFSLRAGRIVRNGPPEATKPEQRKPKKQTPQAPEARW